nr:DUF5916 domain-containing protein [uncultured Mucilaginibacter sp.]
MADIYRTNAQSFQPPALAQRLQMVATRVTGRIAIDGVANESAWASAPVAKNFITSYPREGAPAAYDTEVRLLYDDKNIYVTAVCHFPPGKKGLQVQDMRRDFSFSNNENFQILIDPFKDRRMPVMSFAVSPYGTQMDLMYYADQTYDYKWDAVWQAASTIQEHSWTTEIAIPFATLRYPKSVAEWSINFARNIRNLGELSGWSPWPQAFSQGRLDYGGILAGIVAPQANVNLQIQPYALVNANKTNLSKTKYKPEFGGELKYAISSNTTLEATVNTDFAQAEVDRQVVNLSRSSVFFPERRQFFLENASLFAVGQNSLIQPFFSRRVGLSDGGVPLTLDGGLRFIHQDNKQSAGILAMKQAGDTTQAGALFGVFRYKRNVGDKLQLGVMEVLRQNQAGAGRPSSLNPVEAIDAQWQVSAPLFLRGMVSHSSNTLTGQNGMAAFTEFNYSSNLLYVDWFETAVTKNYQPQTGFVARENFINTQPSAYFYIHKNWFPKSLAFYNPSITADVFHEASGGTFQEANLVIMPFHLVFTNLAEVGISITSSWENLTTNFQPVKRIDIAAHNYRFTRFGLQGRTNAGAPYSAQVDISTGGYYNGSLNSYIIALRAAPIPHIAFVFNYTRNDFKKTGINKLSTTTNLFAPELRLAASPKVLLSGFYQYNTDSRNGSLNARFSWEYRPLSYVYLVVNSLNNYDKATPFNVPVRQQGGILKLTYIHKI